MQTFRLRSKNVSLPNKTSKEIGRAAKILIERGEKRVIIIEEGGD